MRHIPWTVLVTEFIFWGILLCVPIFVFFGDISIEWTLLFALGWGFWIWMHFIAPRLLITRHITLPKIGKYSLKIALISDLHAGPFKGELFFKRVVSHINKEMPDVVLIPGDFLLGTAQKFVQKLVPLKHLRAPTFFTLGNHDHWLNKPGGREAGSKLLRSTLCGFGLRELRNESIEWKPGLWIAGIDDNFYGFDDLEKALQDVPCVEESILLAHSPDIVDKLEKRSTYPGLTVCGHTHGGQMAIPWLVKHVPEMIGNIVRKEFLWGWFSHKRMFVTMGVGESASRARWWVCPEIAILNCTEEKN
jgi:predicted MPP superfamily phosphohydrolase